MDSHAALDRFGRHGQRWRILGFVFFLLWTWFAGLVRPASAADTVISENQARRAGQVSILKNQFRQQGGFASDQLSGFYTALQLFRRARFPFRAREADWPQQTAALIDRAEAILAC